MNKLIIALSLVALSTFGLIYLVNQKTIVSTTNYKSLRDYNQCLDSYIRPEIDNEMERFDVEMVRYVVEGVIDQSPLACKNFYKALEINKLNDDYNVLTVDQFNGGQISAIACLEDPLVLYAVSRSTYYQKYEYQPARDCLN